MSSSDEEGHETDEQHEEQEEVTEEVISVKIRVFFVYLYFIVFLKPYKARVL